MEDALNNLALLFPSVDRTFLEDVYVSSKKDYDQTVDQLLSMGIELDANKGGKPPVSPPVTKPMPTAPPSPPSLYAMPHNMHILTPTPAPVPTPTPMPTPAPIPTSPVPLIPTPMHNSMTMPSISPMTSSASYPTVPYNYNVPVTPPVNMMSSGGIKPATSPAPPKPDAGVEQKRLETLKQELAMEYQRINDTHKYNQELERKLEQLREYTAAEQRKLDDQKAQFVEDKRKFTEELTSRFKAMQEEHNKLKDQVLKQEQEKMAEMEAETDAFRHLKLEEERIRNEEEERRKLMFEEEKLDARAQLDRQLEEAKRECEERLQESRAEMEQIIDATKADCDARLSSKDNEIDVLRSQIEELTAQLETSAQCARERMAEPLAALATSILEGIRASSAAQPTGRTESEKTRDHVDTLVQTIAFYLGKRSQQASDPEASTEEIKAGSATETE